MSEPWSEYQDQNSNVLMHSVDPVGITVRGDAAVVRYCATEWTAPRGYPGVEGHHCYSHAGRSGGRPDGEDVEAFFKWLAVFEKQDDGRWKIVADMWNDDATPES